MKQNKVEEFEFECSRCGKKANLKSSSPVVKATTRPRSAMRNFIALSFLVSGQYFKDYHKIPGTLGLDHFSSTGWPIKFIDWIAPFVKLTGACKKKELKQLDVEISLHCTSSSMAFIWFAATIQTPPLQSTRRRLAKLLRTSDTEQRM